MAVKRFLSALLALALLLGCMGWAPVLAAERHDADATVTGQQPADSKAKEPTEQSLAEELARECKDNGMFRHIDEETFRRAGHTRRLVEEEELNTYVFQNQDGTKSVYYMERDVKYIPCVAETEYAEPYDVRSAAIPDGWGIDRIIEQTHAETQYQHIVQNLERMGYSASENWTEYIVGYNASYSELSELKKLRDCEAVCTDPVIFFPVFSEIDGERRITGCIEIGEESGEFYSIGRTFAINETFLSRQTPSFLDSLDVSNNFAQQMQAFAKDDIVVLLFVRVEHSTGAVMLAYSDSDGWLVYDYQNRAQFSPGKERKVLSLEEFLAQRSEYMKGVRRSNIDLLIWPWAGIAALVVIFVGAGIAVLVLCVRRRKRRVWNGY